MITKFDSLYAGHVDLDNVGYAGTPINDRRYDNAHLVTALDKAQSMAVLMDGLAEDLLHRPTNNRGGVREPLHVGGVGELINLVAIDVGNESR